MSMTPQDNARNAFSAGSAQHAFRLHHVSRHQPLQHHNFGRPGMGVLRPQTQSPSQQTPYSGPYTSNPDSQSIPNNKNSAEQQIAQGILSNASPMAITTGSNTPQRRSSSLGTGIHMPGNSTPRNQSISLSHAVNPSSVMGHTQSQSQSQPQPQPQPQSLSLSQQDSSSASHQSPQQPAQQSAQQSVQQVMISPSTNDLGSTPQDRSIDNSQDMSLIDPQLGLNHEISPSNSSVVQVENTEVPSVVQGEMLSPPPLGSFPTFEALFAFAQAHALAHGYAFVIGRSKRDNRGLKKVFLICDRGGTNKEKIHGEQRQRKTKSRKCGCEFGVFGLENKYSWVLRGRMDGEHLIHNHPPSESPTEHPGARKLDPKAIAAVKALEENGVSVKETLEILHRENPSVRYLPRDIYNARAAIKRDPSRVEATAMEELPTFYKKPPMTFEEKLRAELRTEVANAQAEVEKTKEAWRKEVEELKTQLEEKQKMIEKFELFIDICNQRVMVQRELLDDHPPDGSVGGSVGVS
ncbi:putative mutator-like element protein [Erysiphe neolycopersici]|uniref:Putative mutator-like element protein n=1 Tax=Erysiphe neolycopersici TaxID=212602 RepID=A0A420HTM6_9PEZI|nr:putative mutator-like element protein [Erysiphe neolycopersici]